jgi:hypothetical protein
LRRKAALDFWRWQNFRICFLKPGFQMHLSPPPPPLPEEVELAVDALWLEESALKNRFDGDLFFVKPAFSPQSLECFLSKYRYALPLARKMPLAHALSRLMVGVSGVVTAGSRVLVSQRSWQVTQYPGCFELSPSGGVDGSAVQGASIDYQMMCQRELAEETHIPSHLIKSIAPALLVQELFVLDVCLKIELLEEAPLQPEESEVLNLFWLELDQACLLFKEKVREQSAVPTSATLLACLYPNLFWRWRRIS